MIILAHDGSIYGNWVANYAIRFAATEEDRKLLVIHVEDGKTSSAVIESRMTGLEKSCSERDIDCHIQLLPVDGSVYRTLRHAIPPDSDTLLLCGTRVKPQRNRFLAGSVAENLLRMHHCPVLAIRAVQPGLLGSPHDILYPLSGKLTTDTGVLPFLRRLAPQVGTLHLLRALIVNQLRHPYLTRNQEQLMLDIGRGQIAAVMEKVAPLTEQHPFRTERRIVISSSWSDTVLVQASRLRTELILLGVEERTLAQRIFQGGRLEKVLRESPCDVGIFHRP